MKTEEIIEILKSSRSNSEACRKLGFHANGTGLRKVKTLGIDLNVDLSHFAKKKWLEDFRKYEIITKECPVCNQTFETRKNHSREQIVCSRGCSNTYFRSGQDHPNYIDGNFVIPDGWNKQIGGEHRKICFQYWDHICAIPNCNWYRIIDVHHIDYNHENNDPKNLIPLCPNHHRLTDMSEYKFEINEVITKLIEEKFNFRK